MRTQKKRRQKGKKEAYFRSSCMSGPGYRISMAGECPGVEKMLRQSTNSPKLKPNFGRPSAANSYARNSCGEPNTAFQCQKT